MRDIDKTKRQLISELAELRHQVSQLEERAVERKRAEDTDKPISHLESVIDNANALLDAMDREGNVLLWNRAAEVATGYSREEVLGHNNVWKCLYPDREYRAAIAAKAAAVFEGQMVADMDTTIRTKTGENRTLSWYARNLVDESGHSVGAVWLGTDITERRRAEDALRDIEEFSSGLLNSSPNAILVINPDTSIRYANPALEELTGFASKELSGRKAPYPWWTEERLHRTRRDFQRAITEGVRKVEELFQKKNGERFWVEIRTTPVSRNGQFHYYLSNWVDITERKRAEKAIERARDDYLAITNLTGDIIVKADKEGKCTFANDGACEFWGKRREQLLGQKFAEYLHPDDAEKTNAAVRQSIKTKQTVKGFVNRQETPNGWRIVEWNSSPFFDEKGDYTGFQATGRDITEGKRAEGLLRQSEEKLRGILENAYDVIFQVSPSGVIEYVSPKVKEIYGSSPEDLVGDYLTKTTPRNEVPKALEALKTVLSGEAIKNFEIDQLDGRGKVIPVEMNLGPVKRDGEIVALQGVMRDITERKRAEKEIKASLKEKELLLREVHHRVKNNLQVICSLLKLQCGYVKDEHCAGVFNETQNRVKAMALIHEKLYRAEDLARIDLSGYIKSLVGGLFSAYGADATGIGLRMKVEDIRLGVNYAIPCGLVVNELVSNSLKYAFPNGREGEIKITMHRAGEGEVELAVSDNGIGIPESLDFENPKSLGLRLVTMLAEDQLGGQVALDRTEGTRFQIRFGVVE